MFGITYSFMLKRSATLLPPRRGVGRRAETKLLGSKAAWGGLRQDGREKLTDLFVILTGGRGFPAGGGGFPAVGGGHLEGLPHGQGKAGDTFSSEKTGFNLLTFSFLSTTLYGPQERGNRRIFTYKYKIRS